MTVTLSAAHNSARLTGTLAFLETGSGPARLRIYAGTRPASADEAPDPVASTLLVEIVLTQPAGTLANALLTLTPADDGLIVSSGNATWARLVNGDDQTAADFDCSDPEGDGEIKLVTTLLYLGGAARMVEAVLG